jgi:hypothetical protein
MNVMKLQDYRKGRKRQYLSKYSRHIDRIVSSMLPAGSTSDLLDLFHQYQRIQGHDLAWDYSEFREVLAESISETIAREIFSRMKDEYWFDQRFITLDFVTERCLSVLILGPANAASQK